MYLMTQDRPSLQKVPRTIVVGFDGSDASRRALAVGAQRAGPLGVVVPVHVTRGASSDWSAVFFAPLIAQASIDARRRLSEIADVETGSSTVEPELLQGDPAEVLIEVARRRGADEIVVGSRGLGRIRALLGSVSNALLEKADRPVVVVPKGAAHAGA